MEIQFFSGAGPAASSHLGDTPPAASPAPLSKSLENNRGVTLVELVLVISLVGIIAAMVGVVLRHSMTSYVDLDQRAELVNVADTALQKIQRDLRTALPNSIRVTAGLGASGANVAVEFVPATQVGRYRKDTAPSGSPPGDKLDFTIADNAFDVFGNTVTTSLASGSRLVINNGCVSSASCAAPAGSNLYLAAGGAHVITPSNTTLCVCTSSSTRCFGSACGSVTTGRKVKLSTGHQFYSAASDSRFYVVSTAVTYYCDVAAGTLTRYSGYTITTTQPTNPAAAPLSTAYQALVTNKINSCTVSYSDVASQEPSIVTATVKFTIDNEPLVLFEQVQVSQQYD